MKDCETVLRFDFNGRPDSFKRTPQGFLRVKARLTKTGIFDYENRSEYRPEEEVFRADSLASIKGAPVTDLHPLEISSDRMLGPSNAKKHMVGITENVERDGGYLKGTLLIFHEDTIKAIEAGERSEISLGYTCLREPNHGTHNGQKYDFIQKNITVNHVALGPKGWGRLGRDCVIRMDHKNENLGKDVSTNSPLEKTPAPEANDLNQELKELKIRLDSVNVELENAKKEKAALEDPKILETKVQDRIKLLDRCRIIWGEEFQAEGKSEEELKILAIKKVHPDLMLEGKAGDYIDGLFDSLATIKTERNDSLTSTRQALRTDSIQSTDSAYDKWIQHSARLWTIPLSGSKN